MGELGRFIPGRGREAYSLEDFPDLQCISFSSGTYDGFFKSGPGKQAVFMSFSGNKAIITKDGVQFQGSEVIRWHNEYREEGNYDNSEGYMTYDYYWWVTGDGTISVGFYAYRNRQYLFTSI